MAILIDMDMPENCGKCKFKSAKNVYSFDSVCRLTGDDVRDDTMPAWCPLREVLMCKDCIYWVPDQVGVVEQPYCTRLGCGDKLIGLDLRIGSADHFCCFGERREE